MTKSVSRSNRPRSNHLHPLVYKVVVGLALWTVLAAWGFFGDHGYSGVALAAVSGIFLIAVALPFLLWRIWHNNRAKMAMEGEEPGAREGVRSFREWAFGDLETWQGRLEGRDAIVAILLPILAVAVGMTAFSIVFHFTPAAGG